jgi:hypothetical protein
VIDPAIRIVDLDPREWKNLVHFLSTPAPLPGPEGARRSGGLIVLHAGGRIVKAVHTTRGRVGGITWEGPHPNELRSSGAPGPHPNELRSSGAPGPHPNELRSSGTPGPGALKALARAQGVRWVAALEEGALDELMHRVQERVRMDQDTLDQGLEWARAFRELLQDGRIAVHPRPLEGVPIPQAATLTRALDLALPDDRTAVAYLFDGPEVWSSIVLRKSHGVIDLVAGHRALGLHPAEIRSFLDYPRILDAVKRKFGEPHAGFFAERRTVERLFADPRPGTWARAYALREVIVEPMTPWAGVMLGSGVVREAFDRSRKLLARLDPLGLAQPLARAAREKLTSSVDFKQILGFDPFEVLDRLIRLEDD